MSPSSSRNLRALSLYLPQCITRVSQRSVHAFCICKAEFQAFCSPCPMLGYQHPVTMSPWCHGGRKELECESIIVLCAHYLFANRHKVLNGNISIVPVTLCCCQQYVFLPGRFIQAHNRSTAKELLGDGQWDCQSDWCSWPATKCLVQ